MINNNRAFVLEAVSTTSHQSATARLFLRRLFYKIYVAIISLLFLCLHPLLQELVREYLKVVLKANCNTL